MSVAGGLLQPGNRHKIFQSDESEVQSQKHAASAPALADVMQ